MQTLLGICTGIVSDGEINRTEAAFLRTWLDEHPDVSETWPGNEILATFANGNDGDVLLSLLKSILRLDFSETGSPQPECPALPIDNGCTIIFTSKTFCFTGRFEFGSRQDCEESTQEAGGIACDRITQQLNYLVIGSGINSTWAFESHGRKIEKAVGYREQHGQPKIISESQWQQALQNRNCDGGA